ncbi:MAG: MarR family winged helix-turn-helix transcriptional regulator [Candidatus Pristimantibacillus sp.]
MDYESLELMKVFGRLYRKNIETRIDTFNQKVNEARMLLILMEREQDRMSVMEISEYLGVTSPFVSQLCNDMVERDLIVRAKDPIDRRVVRVSLTEKGKQQASDVLQYSRKLYEGLAEHLGAEESRMLSNLLQKSIDYLDTRIYDSEKGRS